MKWYMERFRGNPFSHQDRKVAKLEIDRSTDPCKEGVTAFY